MIKNLLLIFAFQLCMQCNSQKIEKPMEQTSSFENIKQLEGNWFNTKKSMQNKGILTNLEMECSGKSYWEISNFDGKYSLQKHFSTGKNCENHTIKTNGLTYANGNLSYLEGDILKNETLEKLTNVKFKITEQSFVNGEPIVIESFYEKK